MSQDPEKRYQKLKIREILEDIKEIDAKLFIANYAKKDKSFELAFKSHFLSRVFLGGDGMKYRRMFNELIKPKSSTNSKITPSSKKTIHFILDDFVLQMKDCLSTENYTEAFYIAKESLDKIIYLMYRYEIKDQRLEKNRLNFIKGLEVILNQDLAPSFRKNAESDLIILIRKSYYKPGKYNAILILNSLNAFNSEEKFDIINELFDKATLSAQAINILRTSILLSQNNVTLAKDILLKYDHTKIFEALRLLILDNQLDIVDYYVNENKIAYKYQVTALRCYKYIHTKDFKLLSKEILNLSLTNTDYATFDDIIESLPDTFLRTEFSDIQKWVDGLKFSKCTKIYAKAQRFQELLMLIEEKGDIEWLKVYDETLIEKGLEEGVKELYLSIVDDYFDNHLGNRATEFLDRTKRHLYKISQEGIINDITMHLSKKYAHRKTIKSKLG
ncbi:hypothetical protein N9L92_02910 [Saprospiraceae bacterium]|nr:hypothetical protein [Saprospiraceae bacterium]